MGNEEMIERKMKGTNDGRKINEQKIEHKNGFINEQTNEELNELL